MTLRELYQNIGGEYERATSVLRVEKLIDKHIRKFPDNSVVQSLIDAGKTMDATRLFESAHAMKGVCANLGLTALAALASEIAEEFRPGNPRTRSDAEVAALIGKLETSAQQAVTGIRAYEASL